jgi:hypothetical protein
MAIGIQTITACFDTEELDGGVFGEGVKHSDCVTPTSDTSYDSIWEFATLLEHLGTSLITDDGLEGPDNGGEGMRTDGRADDVVGCVELDDPGAHGFVDSITEGTGSGFDGDDLGTKEFDAEDVEGLSSYIFLEACQYFILWSSKD